MFDAIQPRRGFLAALGSLPFLGGSAAAVDRLKVGTQTAGASAADERATLDDYAAANFDALDVDLDKAREAHCGMWTSLAISLTMMSKSPDECRDLVKCMEDTPGSINTLLTSLDEGAAWFRQAAEIMESAQARFLCGGARLIQEDEESEGADV